MELLGVRQPFTQFQEEKYQMLELNQRLESYLGRVKLLEEENKLLREEIHTLKRSREPPGQRKAQEEALSQTRKMKEKAWREKDRVEMEVENLMEDMKIVSIQRQKEKTAQAETQRRLTESRKELEEERRAQIWLREKVSQLEKDLLLQMQVHQENMETLQASVKQTKQVLMAPQPIQTTSIPDLGQEYSHRAAQAWKEATINYQRQVGHLEESLNQTKTNMAKIHQEKKENQHQLQHLTKELESTKMKREMLEKHVVQQREEQRHELQHLQAQVDALEVEKDTLGQEIDSLMVDRQNLLQVKMSLGLEVATYRALLDSEGLRINRPTTNKTNSTFLLEALLKPTGTHPTSKTTAASSHFSSTVSPSHRSFGSSHTLLTNVTSTWTPTQGTPQRTPTRTSVTDEKRVNISEEKQKAAEESVDHFRLDNDPEALKSTSPHAVTDSVTAEPEPKQEDAEVQKESEPKHSQIPQIDESKTEESALIGVLSPDQPSSLSQTPETESWAGPFTEPARVAEGGKDEDTEVSVEMARLSHAPKVAWEENKTEAEDGKEDASEMDVRSENISESHMVGYGDAENDNTLTLSQGSDNTNLVATSKQEQRSLYSVDGFGYREESNEDLMRVDEKDNVSNISEDVTELMNSETEAAIDSIIEWDREDNKEQNDITVVSPDAEEQGEISIKSDMEKNETEDGNVTERENEEIEVIKKNIDGSLLHTEIQTLDFPKNLDHEESLEDTLPPAETCYQTLNEDHPLPEECDGEEENPDDEYDSPNISASCRTDPGECDSYTQENTIADTRPLICYKSDEETGMNKPPSHFGVGETSDSEDEKERIDGRWGESASKRFNTMEDLSEEPDMDVIGEMITEGIVQIEALDDDREHMILQSGHDGFGDHEGLVVDVVEKESVGTDLGGNQKEESDDDVRDEDHGFMAYKQNENPQLSEEQQIPQTEQPYQEENEMANSYASQENVNTENITSDVPIPETSEEVQPQSSYEVSSTMFQNRTTIKEQIFQESEFQNISVHTNMEFMDNLSLENKINSQPDSHMPNSDQEECNSSEDESPNASQYFQNPTLLATDSANEQPLTLEAQFSNNGVSKADSVSKNVPEEVFSKDFMEKSTEDHKSSQIDDWENFNICTSIPAAEEITYRSMAGGSGQLSPEHVTENLDSPDRMPGVAENISGDFEEHLENTKESFFTKESKMTDIFQRDNPEEEEFLSKEKKSEIDSFFSASFKEDLWCEGKIEMAATYDPTKTENVTHDPIHFNQAMVLEDEWKDLEVMATANGNPKEEMEIIKGQSQDEKLQHKDVQSRQAEMILSDESVDDADSWSSGDE